MTNSILLYGSGRLSIYARLVLSAVAAVGVSHTAGAADAYWRTDGTSGTWTSANWNIGEPNATGGTGWATGNNAVFTADSMLTFATATLGNVTVADGRTITISANQTLTLAGVRTFDIKIGATLNWISQGQSTAAGNEGAGIIKTGSGTLNWGAGPGSNVRFNGGFTLSAGTVSVTGSNAFGIGVMTINGGTLQSSGGNVFAPSSVNIGGSFTFTGSGNDVWGQPVNLSSGTRAITNNTDTGATRTFSGVISGGSGAGLIFAGSGSNGSIILTGANTYSGDTTIAGGLVKLGSGGSIANSPTITISNSARLDVSSASFTLGASQTLKGNGTLVGPATINGTIEPGPPIGTLTFSNAPALAGTVRAEINQANTPTADKMVLTTGTLTYGGALDVVNTGPLITNGIFTLFNSPGGYAGSFSSLSMPGGAVHWDTNRLTTDGTIMFTNRNPVATNLTAGVARGEIVTLTVIGGKHPPSDPDADSLSVTAVSGPVTGGGVAATNGGTGLTYFADASSVLGTNTFNYTVSDSFGGSVTRTVTVVVHNPQGFNRLSPGGALGNGIFTLAYQGIPELRYALDRTADLTPPITWTPLLTNSAGANGALTFNVPNSGAVNFFRTRHVP